MFVASVESCGGRATDSSTARTSAAVGRAAGSLRRSCITIVPKAPEPRAGICGSAESTAWSVAGMFERRYGDMPSTAAYSTTPSDHRSDSGPGRCPSTRSGEMNSGEPTKAPVSVSPCWPSTWAMPKSLSTTRSPRPSRTLSGFTSRCSTPASWAALSAFSTSSPILAASRGSSVPS